MPGKKKPAKSSLSEKEPKIKEEVLDTKPSKARQSKASTSNVLKRADNVVKSESSNGLKFPPYALGSCMSLGAGPSKLLRAVLSSEIINQKLTVRDKIETVSSTLINNLTYNHTFTPFPNRLTCIRWQPKKYSSLLIGGKGGELRYVPDVTDVGLFDHEIDENTKLLSPGIGPGGEIRELQFDESDNNQFYSLNVSGHLIKVNIERLETTEIQPMQDASVTWYGGFCVHFAKRLIFVGDTAGNVHLLPDATRGGEARCKIVPCQKKKISHINFHPRDENMMITCDSGEHSVKVWDIRKITPFKFLAELLHEKPPNSCYFNSDGSMALTTDQGNELRVYNVNNWKLMKTIRHPHRHYQHITPIRAEWHPLADIITVGRYPDDKFLAGDRRTIDFFDYRDARFIRRIEDPGKKLCLLNRFNHTGDILATMTMSDIIIWRQGSHTSKKNLSTKSHKNRSSSDGDSDTDLKKPKGKVRKRPPPRKVPCKKVASKKVEDDIDRIKSKLKSTSTPKSKRPTKRRKKGESTSEESSDESEEEKIVPKAKAKSASTSKGKNSSKRSKRKEETTTEESSFDSEEEEILPKPKRRSRR